LLLFFWVFLIVPKTTQCNTIHATNFKFLENNTIP
jgi:hypothetical protein